MIYGFGAILSLNPYFTWNTDALKLYSIFTLIVGLLYMTVAIRLSFNVVFLLFNFFLLAITLSFSSNGFFPYLNSSVVMLFTFLLMSNDIKLKSYQFFSTLFTASLIPGLLLLFLSFIGANPSWEPLNPISTIKIDADLLYRQYWGAIVIDSLVSKTNIGEVYRFSAIYDEPGVVGTISALLLASRGFDLSKVQSKLLFAAGFLSFSFAFYILALVFILFKRPTLMFKLIAPVAILLLLFHGSLKENTLLNTYFFDRFEQLIDKPKSIDNRASTCFQDEFDEFMGGRSILFGNGYGAHVDTQCDVSSYLTIVYNHGFFGLLMIVLFYLNLTFLLPDKGSVALRTLPFIFVYALSMYQRPDFILFAIIIIYIGVMADPKNTNQTSPTEILT